MWEDLVQRYPDEPKYAARLVRTLNSLGRSYQIGRCYGRDLLKQAEQAFQDGQAAAERWGRDHTGGPDFRESLAWPLSNFGSLYRITDRPSAAQTPLEQAILLGEHLVANHSQEARYQGVLLHALTELSQVYFLRGQANPAETTLRRARAVAERLAHDHPGNGEYREQLARTVCFLGDVSYRLRGQLTEARARYEEAVATWERLTTQFPDVWSYRGGLVASQGRLEELLQEAGDFRPCGSGRTSGTCWPTAPGQ